MPFESNNDIEMDSSFDVTPAVFDGLDEERGLNEAILQADSNFDAPVNGLGNTMEPLFKVEYHPHSGILLKIGFYSDCFPHHTIPPPNFKPWKPFKSQLDFEIAELELEAALSKSQLNCLIK
ncbi:hypothetical protein H2248_002097 [Termitomyces sp. 'cryptogamus']|nr:hypothetical protein H2248_002097 [Termitomyces sp. 'cryptogamus']